MAEIIKTLEKGCQFLNFEDVKIPVKKNTAKPKVGEAEKQKTFYEDPTL